MAADGEFEQVVIAEVGEEGAISCDIDLVPVIVVFHESLVVLVLPGSFLLGVYYLFLDEVADGCPGNSDHVAVTLRHKGDIRYISQINQLSGCKGSTTCKLVIFDGKLSLDEDVLVDLVDEAEAFPQGEGLQDRDDVYEMLGSQFVLYLVEVGDFF